MRAWRNWQTRMLQAHVRFLHASSSLVARTKAFKPEPFTNRWNVRVCCLLLKQLHSSIADKSGGTDKKSVPPLNLLFLFFLRRLYLVTPTFIIEPYFSIYFYIKKSIIHRILYFFTKSYIPNPIFFKTFTLRHFMI